MKRSLLLLVAAAVLLGIAEWGAGPRTRVPVKIADMQPLQGFAYTAPISPVLGFGPPDTNERTHQSPLRLYEGDRELGPAHAVHEDIRNKGSGAFSHWGANVMFSASDNSDPRTNPWRYSIAYHARVPLAARVILRIFGLVLLIPMLVALRRLWLRFREGVARRSQGMHALLSPATLLLTGLFVAPGLLYTALAGWALGSQNPDWLAQPFRAGLVGPLLNLWVRWLPGLSLGAGVLCFSYASAGASVARLQALRGYVPLMLVLTPLLFLACLGQSLFATSLQHPLDHDEYANFLGRLPWSDAESYYQGGREFLDTGEITQTFGQRRPVNVSLLALRLAVTRNDLMAATVLQALFLAMAVFLAMHYLSIVFGVAPGLIFMSIVLAFARLFITTTLSEPLGIGLACLSLPLVAEGFRMNRTSLLAWGLFGLGLAEASRAGSVLAIPTLILGYALARRDTLAASARTVALLALAGLAGISASPTINALYSNGRGTTGGNLAPVLAGMSLGKSWGEAYETYAVELKEAGNERQEAAILMRHAVENIRRDPTPFLSSMSTNLHLLYWQTPAILLSLVFAESSFDIQELGTMFFYAACLLPMFTRRSRTPKTMWKAYFPGLFLSAFFHYATGGWRVLASGWVFLAAFLGCLLSDPASGDDTAPPSPPILKTLRTSLAVVALLAVVAPLMLTRLERRPEGMTCAVKDIAVVRHPRFDPTVFIGDEDLPGLVRVPRAEVARREKAALVGLGFEMPSPSVLTLAYDYKDHLTRRILSPPAFFQAAGDWFWVRLDKFPGPTGAFAKVTSFGVWTGCGSVTTP